MQDTDSPKPTRPLRRRTSANRLPYIVLVSVVCIALFFLYRSYSGKIAALTTEAIQAPSQVELDNSNETSIATGADMAAMGGSNKLLDTTAMDQAEPQAQSEDGIQSFTGTSDGILAAPPSQVSFPGQQQRQQQTPSEAAVHTIREFYEHLDGQPYLDSFQLQGSSEEHFSSLIQKLLDNPPIVSGETDDLFNILQNTAHFFRIVGKDNIILMKAILDREKDSFEQVLANFYQLTSQPEALQEGFSLTIPSKALYDYAGFFLTTMGGRLYLFRRDSVSRMVVSYYSILIVERAVRQGRNSHGIDIRPTINKLIQELEASGAALKLKETYLDNLYELKEQYL